METDKRTLGILLLIFIFALAIRFVYFPQDIYFAYDQARDSYLSLEILKGDFKILGPPSAASSNLFAGALLYYIYAVIYFFSNNNVEVVAAVFRIYNSLGIFLVYAIGQTLFNKKTGLVAALLFAASYEQSQYSLFLSHQALATISVLIFYLGLGFLFFKNNQKGLVLAAVGAGLSIQFHYLYGILIPLFFLLLIVFRKKVTFSPKYTLASFVILLTIVSTYILAELKFGFKFLKFATQLGDNSGLYLNQTLTFTNRLLRENFLVSAPTLLLWIALGVIVWFFVTNKELKSKGVFLLVWLGGGLAPYLLSGTPSYYYAASAMVSLQIATSFLIYKLWERKSALALLVILGLVANNLNLIKKINPTGVNSDFIIQPRMLLTEQRRALDYIYSQTGQKPFAVKSLTVPLNINTTWDFLFATYGKKQYGYTPTWAGPVAAGFPRTLEIVNSRSDLPQNQFLIIEPTRGIKEHDKEEFFKEESFFTKVIEKKNFGTIMVEKRETI